MKSYVGLKLIEAEPCQKDGKDGYKVVYEDSYESWSPKTTFEDAYHASGEMSFSDALFLLKRGKKIARKGWNGKGMFLTLQAGSEVDGNGKVKIWLDDPHIDMKAADGSCVVGWIASQSDMLSDDWCVVE